MIVRRLEQTDAAAVSELIRTTLRISNSNDYSEDFITREIDLFTPEYVLKRAEWTHFYVVCDADRILGCGAVGPYWGKEDESSLFTIFVHPEAQGRGIGRKIIEVLEKDAFFLRAKRVEIPASITGTPFYLRMGYRYKSGVSVPDEEGLLRLEKYRDDCGRTAHRLFSQANTERG